MLHDEWLSLVLGKIQQLFGESHAYLVQVDGGCPEQLLHLTEHLPPGLLVLLLKGRYELVEEIGQQAGDGLEDHNGRHRIAVFLVPTASSTVFLNYTCSPNYTVFHICTAING